MPRRDATCKLLMQVTPPLQVSNKTSVYYVCGLFCNESRRFTSELGCGGRKEKGAPQHSPQKEGLAKGAHIVVGNMYVDVGIKRVLSRAVCCVVELPGCWPD